MNVSATSIALIKLSTKPPHSAPHPTPITKPARILDLNIRRHIDSAESFTNTPRPLDLHGSIFRQAHCDAVRSVLEAVSGVASNGELGGALFSCSSVKPVLGLAA
ncbi:hypothetical protein [Nonomuraea sp. NPDC049725]|uniref:hypothetical protein n=1 Tax=Nonomuraea sp. NPDC049725 TaxID=3154508 RepID=UPI00341F2326